MARNGHSAALAGSPTDERGGHGDPPAHVHIIAGVLPGLDVAAARHYCEQHVPPHVIDQLRTELDVSRGALTIMECRPPWRADFGPEWTRRGVARLRYTAKSGLWTLYWKDRNDRWHRYDLIEPSADILALLDEIDRDPTGIFWG